MIVAFIYLHNIYEKTCQRIYNLIAVKYNKETLIKQFSKYFYTFYYNKKHKVSNKAPIKET